MKLDETAHLLSPGCNLQKCVHSLIFSLGCCTNQNERNVNDLTYWWDCNSSLHAEKGVGAYTTMLSGILNNYKNIHLHKSMQSSTEL
jgi:hypothetical protein